MYACYTFITSMVKTGIFKILSKINLGTRQTAGSQQMQIHHIRSKKRLLVTLASVQLKYCILFYKITVLII